MTRRELLSDLSHALVRLHVDTPIAREMLPPRMRDAVDRAYHDADMLLWDADDRDLSIVDVRTRVAASRYLTGAIRQIYATMDQPDIAARYEDLDHQYRKVLSALLHTPE